MRARQLEDGGRTAEICETKCSRMAPSGVPSRPNTLSCLRDGAVRAPRAPRRVARKVPDRVLPDFFGVARGPPSCPRPRRGVAVGDARRACTGLLPSRPGPLFRVYGHDAAAWFWWTAVSMEAAGEVLHQAIAAWISAANLGLCLDAVVSILTRSQFTTHRCPDLSCPSMSVSGQCGLELCFQLTVLSDHKNLDLGCQVMGVSNRHRLDFLCRWCFCYPAIAAPIWAMVRWFMSP